MVAAIALSPVLEPRCGLASPFAAWPNATRKDFTPNEIEAINLPTRETLMRVTETLTR
jgi:hypothetical protein